MATLVLSAAGAAIGSTISGTVLGLSGAVIGRAVGATWGRAIDQKIMGAGAQAVDGPRIDRLRLSGAGEGAAIAQVWGRMRVAGHVIWASQFEEHQHRQHGGKGSGPSVRNYSYTVSLAIGLCHGPIMGIGRIWADGAEIAPSQLNLRVYTGSSDQQPDPKITTIQGQTPAFRGLAYVLIEDLDVTSYGNRVPQFSFEVIRQVQSPYTLQSDAITAVAMIPGTGEYSLSTQKLYRSIGLGENETINTNSPSGKSDFLTSLDQLGQELPNCRSISLVVSWFGDDLRAGECEIRPKVEQRQHDARKMPWRVSGLTRDTARLVPQSDDRPIYGGTPTDQSVIEAIRAIKNTGREVMFYPFILMDQQAGNQLPNPYTGELGQPALPWRGRITSAGPDRGAQTQSEVAAFFGNAQPQDFIPRTDHVTASQNADWKLRRFILHYAHLCKLAGGVNAFCIGSEMVGLTRMRDQNDIFPAVAALCDLAQDVRDILGADCKITYAADWTEYGSYQTGGNLYYPLDPLWAHPQIDFIGIDNYMPLSDWRDTDNHADSHWSSIYALDYLKANISGGEGYDWFYDSLEAQTAQRRLPITDGAEDEPWVYRVKDLANWWGLSHHLRQNGQRQTTPTAWIAQSKPIRFTEYGCAAVDKASNEPNKFIDLQSSESTLPRASLGGRDDLIQMQYYRAMAQYWRDPSNNPQSGLYNGPMVEADYSHAWAWDARPFPAFPARTDLWADGQAYVRGHWLNGRASNQPLAGVIADLTQDLPSDQLDLSQVYGLVRGYSIDQIQSPRAGLQPLMLAYGIDANESDGKLRFTPRRPGIDHIITPNDLARPNGQDGDISYQRQAPNDSAAIVQLAHIEAEGDFNVKLAQARLPQGESHSLWQSELPLSLSAAEGRDIAARWLAEAHISKDRVRLSLPPSRRDVKPGDRLALPDGGQYRVEEIEYGDCRQLEASRIEGQVYRTRHSDDTLPQLRPFTSPVPVKPIFMDLPLLDGSENPHQPHLAIAARPWPGAVALWSAPGTGTDESFSLDQLFTQSAIIGVTQSPLRAAKSGLWDNGAPLRVKLTSSSLSSASMARVLNGANAMAIGHPDDSQTWEVFQFTTAQMVAPRSYDLSQRLRGQCGTDGIMPDVWPIGSVVVVLNKAIAQIDLPANARNLARRYRIGATSAGIDSEHIVEETHSFAGNGLRPYSVAHLRAKAQPSGGMMLSWIRRSRLNGDDWSQIEIPLAEESESYTVDIYRGTSRLAQYQTTTPNHLIAAQSLSQWGGAAGLTATVRQLSMRYGPGPGKTLAL